MQVEVTWLGVCLFHWSVPEVPVNARPALADFSIFHFISCYVYFSLTNAPHVACNVTLGFFEIADSCELT